MNRPWILPVAGTLVIAVLVGWIARNTSWVEVDVPVAPAGDAAKPYYALRQVAKAAGTSVTEQSELEPMPPTDATLLLESRFWDLFPERDEALRRWVESGGRLVVFQQEIPAHRLGWVPSTFIRHVAPKPARSASGADEEADDGTDANAGDDAPPRRGATRRTPFGANPAFLDGVQEPICENLVETAGSRPAFEPGRGYRRCLRPAARPGCVDPAIRRNPHAAPVWELGNDDRPYAMRVAVGRGSVTAVAECLPVNNDAVLLGDHALIDAAVLGFRPGGGVWIVDDEAGERLPLWLWHHARAPVLLTAAAVALALWRLMVRFGPREAPLPPARRSMGEQVRGTGQFIADTDPRALHAATRHAVDAAARPRVEGYDELDDAGRAAAIATRLAPGQALDVAALAAALGAQPRAQQAQWLAAIETLEVARRALLRAAATPPP